MSEQELNGLVHPNMVSVGEGDGFDTEFFFMKRVSAKLEPVTLDPEQDDFITIAASKAGVTVYVNENFDISDLTEVFRILHERAQVATSAIESGIDTPSKSLITADPSGNVSSSFVLDTLAQDHEERDL